MVLKNILEKALSGSEEAFEKLINASYSTVYRFAWRYVGKQEDAEDITWETFLKIADLDKAFNLGELIVIRNN